MFYPQKHIFKQIELIKNDPFKHFYMFLCINGKKGLRCEIIILTISIFLRSKDFLGNYLYIEFPWPKLKLKEPPIILQRERGGHSLG